MNPQLEDYLPPQESNRVETLDDLQQLDAMLAQVPSTPAWTPPVISLPKVEA